MCWSCTEKAIFQIEESLFLMSQIGGVSRISKLKKALSMASFYKMMSRHNYQTITV